MKKNPMRFKTCSNQITKVWKNSHRLLINSKTFFMMGRLKIPKLQESQRRQRVAEDEAEVQLQRTIAHRQVSQSSRKVEVNKESSCLISRSILKVAKAPLKIKREKLSKIPKRETALEVLRKNRKILK